ncbi:Protein of unknown function [Gryllus bimaculatus]|nr:Protein of unknown function [Gryllus bimaculatus]
MRSISKPRIACVFSRTVEAHSFGNYFGVWVATLHLQCNLIVCSTCKKWAAEIQQKAGNTERAQRALGAAVVMLQARTPLTFSPLTASISVSVSYFPSTPSLLLDLKGNAEEN